MQTEPDDGRAAAANQHRSAARQPEIEAVGVTGRHHGDAAGLRHASSGRRSRRSRPRFTPFTATTRLRSDITGFSGIVVASGGGTTPYISSPGRTRSNQTRESRSVAALLAACTQPRADAELRQSRQHLVEPLALLLKQRQIRDRRRSRNACRRRRSRGCALGHELRQRVLQIVVAQSEPVHAGVDLEMAPQRTPRAGGRGLERPTRARRGNRRREVVVEHAFDVAHAERAEDQNLGGDAGLAAGRCLLRYRPPPASSRRLPAAPAPSPPRRGRTRSPSRRR